MDPCKNSMAVCVSGVLSVSVLVIRPVYNEAIVVWKLPYTFKTQEGGILCLFWLPCLVPIKKL